jgi:hypothetical protein
MPSPDACFYKIAASRIPDPKSITTEKPCFQEFLDHSFAGIYSRAEYFDHTGYSESIPLLAAMVMNDNYIDRV